MNNKLNNMLNDFFENTDGLNDEEMDKALQDFMMKYNKGELEYTDTALDNAYELLSEAEDASSKSEALKLAKEAYKVSPECFDAILFQVELEDDFFRAEEFLNEGLKKEKERLQKQNYFQKNNIGRFYGIFETRPYINGLSVKAHQLAVGGKYKLAIDTSKEVLRLNSSDNTGIRYLLMALYAMLEDEKELISLSKKFPENNLSMLFPTMILYYKKGEYEKAREYLVKINELNPNLVKILKGKLKANPNEIDGYYRVGDSSEVFMYFEDYMFLLLATPSLGEFVLKYSKPKKKK